jgi:hypothetical protein
MEAVAMAPARSRERTPAPLALSRWLLVVALMIIAIVVVGGITRLTESGVSITEWKPVSGALPPLTDAEWQAEFDKYRQTPQYVLVNGPAGMTLATYKFIFFWEWVHRLLARAIGMAFALPLAWFWLRGAIPAGYKPRLLALLALGALQGAVGWWMVKSGIVHDVKVSHFRLAAHLLVALTTLAGIIWTMLDLRSLVRGEPRARLTGFALRNGVGLLEASNLGRKATPEGGFQLALEQFERDLKAGVAVDESLGRHTTLTSMDLSLLRAGQKSGSLGKMFDVLADGYDDKLSDMMKRLTALIEPLAIGVISVLVGVVALSLVLALSSVYDTVL